jgi:hypothetical protein
MFNRRSFFANCLGLASIAVLGKIPSDTVPTVLIPGESIVSKRFIETHGHHIPHLTLINDLNRISLRELGRRGPYYRYVHFPIEITESFNG